MKKYGSIAFIFTRKENFPSEKQQKELKKKEILDNFNLLIERNKFNSFLDAKARWVQQAVFVEVNVKTQNDNFNDDGNNLTIDIQLTGSLLATFDLIQGMFNPKYHREDNGTWNKINEFVKLETISAGKS